MASKKSNPDAVASDTRDGVTPSANRAEDRKQRLAAQLRENLKKRKELARSRKSGNDGSI